MALYLPQTSEGRKAVRLGWLGGGGCGCTRIAVCVCVCVCACVCEGNAVVFLTFAQMHL